MSKNESCLALLVVAVGAVETGGGIEMSTVFTTS